MIGEERQVEKKPVRTYRDLIVWQKAHELAKKVLAVCRKYPNSDEARIIKTQVIKSSTSVPANIAEGFGGNKGKVFQNSLTIARREASETDYWLLLSFEERYIKDSKEYVFMATGYREVIAMLSSLINKVSKPLDP
jgi:four helix bundle protein